jgi:hypothetical protein
MSKCSFAILRLGEKDILLRLSWDQGCGWIVRSRRAVASLIRWGMSSWRVALRRLGWVLCWRGSAFLRIMDFLWIIYFLWMSLFYH